MLDFDFARPADGRLHVGSGWSASRSGGRRHAALDIGLPVGTPVRAMQRGVVIRSQAISSGDAGIWVGIRHPHLGGAVTRYLHLSRVLVPEGAQVARGQVIGYSGNTGLSSAPHLHVDLKVPVELLAAVAAVAGKPSDGWAPLQAPYGHGIPGEPWVPVDSYRDDTIRAARERGIPLYGERARPAPFIAKLALTAFVAWGAYRLLR